MSIFGKIAGAINQLRPEQKAIATRVANKQLVEPTHPLRVKISNPSVSVDEVNIPEVTSVSSEFIYNFYTQDERVLPFEDNDYTLLTQNAKRHTGLLPLNKIPRYVLIKWSAPRLSEFESSKEIYDDNSTNNGNVHQKPREPRERHDITIRGNHDKIISEDNFFNPGYITHTFSNVSAIEQGGSDIENFTRLSRIPAESMFQMAREQIRSASKTQNVADIEDDRFTKTQLGALSDAYVKLSDFPKTSLGLRVFDESGNPSDKDDLLRSITKSVTLSMKINSSVIADIFKDSVEKTTKDNLASLQISHSNSKVKGYHRSNTLKVIPIQNDETKASLSSLTQPVKIIGYIIDRYIRTADGFKQNATFYIESCLTTHFEDRTVLYGTEYTYAIRTVAAVKILTYSADKTSVDMSTLYVSSRPISVHTECFEHVPPPQPNDIKFTFDYTKRKLKIHWDTPVNHQKDVKQFQVFRRKSINEPFELIAQYGFDTSLPGPNNQGRYKTNERVDCNNIENMNEDDKVLIHSQGPESDQSYPVFMHIDPDFTVDTEFFISSDYIYAICSIDAHGMISNYSSQHRVIFDAYKNRLNTKVICDAGSPRQYPNMNLRLDAFKDTIRVSGDSARQLNVYFTPEYLKVKDDKNKTYKVVEAQIPGQQPFYLLQLINLDNQKMQTIRISIKDPKNLTA